MSPRGRPQDLLTRELIREVYEVDAEILTDSDGLMRIFYQPNQPRRRETV